MPGQANEGMSRVGADVPASHHEALYQLAKFRDAETPRDVHVSMAKFIREGVRLRLAVAKASGDLPQPVADQIENLDPQKVLQEFGIEAQAVEEPSAGGEDGE